ncbi:phage tail protein [Lysinibacillus xylanilyticus]|uniref:phage tail protein n=1 Tax=Lysinibacillus xylanilyticus TaxID=582475 RepID=UPI002E1B6106|nr:phage tail protein [Lysinibacillus xylanilyticus]
MLIVTNGSKTEPLLETNYEKFEELNGVLRISFNSFLHEKNPGHPLLDFETIIEDEDGQEYVVKDYGGDTISKKATAVHIYFSLADEFKYDIYGGTRTFDDFMSFVFAETGWTFINVDVDGYQLLPNFGEANLIVLIDQLCAAFNCERQILPGKVLRFTKKIGADNDMQFRYRHNIETLSYSVNTANLKTQIRGYGAEGIDITYTSPLADSPRIGVRVADPIHDEKIESAEEMTTHLASELPAAPETNIKVKVTTVDGNVGDLVWLIHEDLALEYQTRILSKKTKRDYSNSEVEVGNTQAKSIVDALLNQHATINANDKRYRSKFEQTNDRIDLEVEEIGASIAAIHIRADSITQSVTDLNNNLSSRITQTATEIRSEVTAQVTTINNNIRSVRNDVSAVTQTASQIQSTVTSQQTQISGLGTRVSTAESTITQQADQIKSKVSFEDFTGNTVVSQINQTATTISIQASKINLVGAVTFLSDITGRLGTITAGTINGVDIYGANINIQQDASIGSTLYLQGTTNRGIVFHGNNTIYANGTYMDLSAPYVRLNGNYNEFNGYNTIYGQLNVPQATGLSGLVRANSSGIGISTSRGNLYVQVNGSTIGSVKLT